jgi:hypothetical protein
MKLNDFIDAQLEIEAKATPGPWYNHALTFDDARGNELGSTVEGCADHTFCWDCTEEGE